MKISIENSLKKTTFKVSPKSLLCSFEIGCAKMDNSKIADNIMGTVDQLEWPGGWKNISRIYLRPMQPSKVSIPIYASALNPNDAEVPVITGAKQNRCKFNF
jgi:ribosomal protein L1